jgi:hypothetical protein
VGGLVTAAAFAAAGLYLALTDGVAVAVQTLGVTLLLIVAVLVLVAGVTWGTHRLVTTRGVEP